MADSTISNLPASTGVDPTNDVLPIVHTSTTQKVSPQDIVDAAFPQVPFTPTGSISATTVAGAINELDAEKAGVATLPTAMNSATAQAGTSTVPQTISAFVLQTQKPTAMDSATAQAGTSTTPQTVSASVLQAGVTANAQLALKAEAINTGSNGFMLNSQTVTQTYDVPVGYNALAVGPITLAPSVAFNLPAGSISIIL